MNSNPSSKTREISFKEVGTFGAQVSMTEANYKESMQLLESNGMKALTYKEALVLLMKDEVLKNTLKDKWFWLAGNGVDREESFTIDEKGDIVKETEKNKEKLVRAWSGNNTPYLMVLSDDFADYVGRRFGIGGYDAWPGDIAPAVVGVSKDFTLDAVNNRMRTRS